MDMCHVFVVAGGYKLSRFGMLQYSDHGRLFPAGTYSEELTCGAPAPPDAPAEQSDQQHQR